ncbi:MAG TPA: GMC family oxidoreductase [Rhizomicrobium sp.]|nr:GMC family oxidoreductase [Rhizomicrobium sp.]
MNRFIDARSVSPGTALGADILLIGGGPAGISLALALKDSGHKVILLESGGMEFEAATQALYEGPETGTPYLPLNASRMRFFGGSTNHWGGWCRPLDRIDFEARDWLAHSGWPFGRAALEPYYPRAQELVEAGPFLYDDAPKKFPVSTLAMGAGGLETVWFQFSKMRGSVLPTHFGERYAEDLKQISNVQVYTHANVTGLRLTPDAKRVHRVEVATLSGVSFSVSPKLVVLGAGAVENARLMLASNDVVATGVGNGNDLVGRYFSDHPIPGNNATLVSFGGKLSPFFLGTQSAAGARIRAAFAPTDSFRRAKKVLGALITVDGGAKLDALGQAAVETVADSLGVDARKAHAYTIGCGFEPAPDPERRITLTGERDGLGMPRVTLHNTISDADFVRYRTTLEEWGRQLQASGAGMLRIHHATQAEWLEGLDWANHHMGTTRMHDDPKRGVVDANGRVHGMGNLFVAGSGCFPTFGASNPTMNLVALTLRLADHLKGLTP